MTKQYIIRHKETHKQLFTSRGKKSNWKTVGHAKAAFTNLRFDERLREEYGVNLRSWTRFDDQGVFEIVEVTPIESLRMEKAEKLLKDALRYMDNTHGYDTDLWYAIQDFLGMDE